MLIPCSSHQFLELYQPWVQCVHVKLIQSCLTHCDPMDCNPPGSTVHRILQTRLLEWVAMPSSRGSSWPRDGTCISLDREDPLEECMATHSSNLEWRIPWTLLSLCYSYHQVISPPSPSYSYSICETTQEYASDSESTVPIIKWSVWYLVRGGGLPGSAISDGYISNVQGFISKKS